MRLWALIAVLAASCGSCEPDPPVTEPDVDAPTDDIELPTPDLRLVFLTDLKGYLEPCGCTSDMLGGIDRMRHRLRQLESEAPTAFYVTGDLFFGNESHAGPSGRETEMWQAQAVVSILQEAGLDAATPGAADYARLDELKQLIDAAEFPVIASGWTVGESELAATTTTELDSTTIRVVGISKGRPGADDAAAREALADEGLRIVLASGSRRDARTWSELDVDFIVLGGIDREDPSAPSERNETWILQGGRQGQGLLVVDLYRPSAEGAWQNLSQWTLDAQREELDTEIESLASQLESWREEGTHEASDLQRQEQRLDALRDERRNAVAPAFPETGRVFAARWEPLEQSLEGDPETRSILEALDIDINDHNRRAFADRTPPPVEDGAAHYVGSGACASCHAEAHRVVGLASPRSRLRDARRTKQAVPLELCRLPRHRLRAPRRIDGHAPLGWRVGERRLRGLPRCRQRARRRAERREHHARDGRTALYRLPQRGTQQPLPIPPVSRHPSGSRPRSSGPGVIR